MEYTNVLLSLLRGNTYSSSISKDLGKAQPTITEELKTLEKDGAISRLKRDNAQRYELNWPRVFEIVCEEIEKISSCTRSEIDPNFPELFVTTFLTYYAKISGSAKDRSLGDILSSLLQTLTLVDEKQSRLLKTIFRLTDKEINNLLKSARMLSIKANSIVLLAHWGSLRKLAQKIRFASQIQ